MNGIAYGHGSLARRTLLVLLAVVAIVGTMATSGATAPNETTLVSSRGTGVQGDGDSVHASVSADGRYVAFESDATNLVGGDLNGGEVFVRDRQTGQVQRVSVSSAEVQSDLDSTAPSISADGRYVAFLSSATNLVPGDANGKADVFVRDRQLGTTQLVSVNSGEVQGNEESYEPSISADGRYVAFGSKAGNLVGGDIIGKVDVFVRDRTATTTQRVSVAGGGTEADDESSSPSISGDGRYVAYESRAKNLAGNDTNGKLDVFVYDRTAQTTERVSVTSAEAEGLDDSAHPSISDDGRYVAFESGAPLVGGALAEGGVFMRDRTAGTTQRISVSSSETSADAESVHASISGDGRFVAFESSATNLVAGDLNGKSDIFVRDRTAGNTERASVSTSRAEGNEESIAPEISSSGSFVAFESKASNLVASDLNGKADVFMRERAGGGGGGTGGAPTVTTVTPADGATDVPASSNVTATFSEAMQPATINANTVKLVVQGTTAKIPATVTYDAATRTATLNPTADLAAGAYQATVGIGAKDSTGTPLDQNSTQAGNQGKNWRFTVTSAPPPVDTTPPTVTAVTPAENAAAVDPTSSVTATFSEAMQPASISTTTVRLVVQGTTTAIPATVSYDAATRTATLDPSAVLAPGAYQATVTIGAKDTAGNQLDQNSTTTGNQPKTWRFTVS